MVKWESDDNNVINEQIVKLLNMAVRNSISNEEQKNQENENERNSKKEGKELYKKRQKILNKTKLSNKEKLELNQLNKLIKIQRREYSIDKENEMIEQILEENMGIKQIKKNLMLGNKWTSYLMENNERVADRRGINEVATKFYKKLYAEEKTDKDIRRIEQDEEREPPFMMEELDCIIRKLKCNKSPGKDGITNEQIKYAGEEFKGKLLDFLNQVYRSKNVPKGWKTNKIIVIFKKGDKHRIENYRPLSLTSNMAKVLAKLIKNRLKSHYEHTQPEEQAGFRSGYSTINNLHIINQVIEKGGNTT